MFLLDKYTPLMYYCIEVIYMSASNEIKAVLRLCNKKQLDLAAHFNMSTQTMSNKMARGSWSASDLVEVAEFTGCKVAFILPDGRQIVLENEE